MLRVKFLSRHDDPWLRQFPDRDGLFDGVQFLFDAAAQDYDFLARYLFRKHHPESPSWIGGGLENYPTPCGVEEGAKCTRPSNLARCGLARSSLRVWPVSYGCPQDVAGEAWLKFPFYCDLR